MNFVKIITGLFSSEGNPNLDKSKYKTLDSVSKAKEVDLIPYVEIPDNTKKNIVIIDDNDIAGDITKEDIKVLGRISKVLNEKISIEDIEHRYRALIEKFDNKTLDDLSHLCLDEYEITLITGKMAGFSLINALKKGLIVDYAVLDIILGGSGLYKDTQTILDGIDVAKDILESNPKANVMFYTGCSFEKGQEEYKKVSKLTDNMEDMVLHKGNDLLHKKKKLIELLSRPSRFEV